MSGNYYLIDKRVLPDVYEKVVNAKKLLREGKVTSCGCRTQSLGEEKIEKILLENNFNYAKEYLVQTRENHRKSRFDFAIFNEENKLLYFIE